MIKLEPAPQNHPTSIPDELSAYLSAASRDDITSIAQYVEIGADLVSRQAVEALRRLLPAVHRKVAKLDGSPRLQQRVRLLATYFNEAGLDGHAGTPAHREAAFALLYFLKGFDRIPDTVPDIGLLDDALVIDRVIHRNAAILRAHWLRYGRTWLAET